MAERSADPRARSILGGPAILFAVWVAACTPASTPDSGEDAHAEEAPYSLEIQPSGEVVLVLSEEARETAGIETALPEPCHAVPVDEAYGVVEVDPSRTSGLRAPLAGELEASSSWPALADRLAAGAVLGHLKPRVVPLTPLETGDLRVRRATAVAEVEAAEAELVVATSGLQRVEALNRAERSASDQAVEEARARLIAAQAKQSAARRGLEVWDELLRAPAPPLAALPLTTSLDGEVVAVLARPGESVEAGAELLRTADLSVVLARVELRSGVQPSSLPAEAKVVRVGASTPGRPATVLGPAPSSNPSLGTTLLLRVADPAGDLRPGTRVIASFPRIADAVDGLRIADAALVRLAGGTYVYVEVEQGHYTRRAVTVRRIGDEGVITEGLAAESPVVTVGAALLLSEELLSSGGGDEE